MADASSPKRASLYSVLSDSCASLASLCSSVAVPVPSALPDLKGPAGAVASLKRLSGLEPSVAYRENSLWWSIGHSSSSSRLHEATRDAGPSHLDRRSNLRASCSSTRSLPVENRWTAVEDGKVGLPVMEERRARLDAAQGADLNRNKIKATDAHNRSRSVPVLPTKLRPPPLIIPPSGCWDRDGTFRASSPLVSEFGSLSSSSCDSARSFQSTPSSATSNESLMSPAGFFDARRPSSDKSSIRSKRGRHAHKSSADAIKNSSLYVPVLLPPVQPQRSGSLRRPPLERRQERPALTRWSSTVEDEGHERFVVCFASSARAIALLTVGVQFLKPTSTRPPSPPRHRKEFSHLQT
jgi:hypothetical protein